MLRRIRDAETNLVKQITEPYKIQIKVNFEDEIKQSDKKIIKLFEEWPEHCWGITKWNDPDNIYIRSSTPKEWQPFIILNELCKKLIATGKAASIMIPPNTKNKNDWSKGPRYTSHYLSSLPWRVAAFSWAFNNADKLLVLDLPIPKNLLDIALENPSGNPQEILGLGFYVVKKRPVATQSLHAKMQELMFVLNRRFQRQYKLHLFSNINELPLLYRGWPSDSKAVTVMESNTIYLNKTYPNELAFLILEEFAKKLARDGLLLEGNPFDKEAIQRIDPPPEYTTLGHVFMSPDNYDEYSKVYHNLIVHARKFAVENYALTINFLENHDISNISSLSKLETSLLDFLRKMNSSNNL